MVTKVIAWQTGSGNITLTYQGQGDGPITVQSDANDLSVARSQQITIETTNGSPVVAKTITISQAAKSYPQGVWAYYADGSIRDYASADSNAIGVAVVTANCGFVIDKLATNGNNRIRYGGHNKDLSNIGVVVTKDVDIAKLDFAGEDNTTKLINALDGYNDGYVTGAAAAEACRAAFGGNGYMGSLGEWNEAYANKSAVDSMMVRIGGTEILTNRAHWSSTIANASVTSWNLNWNNGYLGSTNSRSYNALVRAFKAL